MPGTLPERIVKALLFQLINCSFKPGHIYLDNLEYSLAPIVHKNVVKLHDYQMCK